MKEILLKDIEDIIKRLYIKIALYKSRKSIKKLLLLLTKTY